MVEVLSEYSSNLGEGTVWSAKLNSLFWLDINNRLFLSWTEGMVKKHQLPFFSSKIVLNSDDLHSVWLITNIGLVNLSLDSMDYDVVLRFPFDSSIIRGNDGVVDPNGNLWFGTMAFNADEKSGGIHVIDSNGTFKTIIPNFGIPNTFVWLTNNEILISDSFKKLTYKYTVDFNSLSIVSREIFHDFSSVSGTPDGGIMLADGSVLIANWGGNCLSRHDKNGNLLQTIDLPVTQPSCVIAGGEMLNKLFVTSATESLSVENTNEFDGKLLLLESDFIGHQPISFSMN